MLNERDEMKNTMTLREKAAEMIQASVKEAATKQHERNYEKLHVLRDGTVSWYESTNKSDDIIDRHADGFAPVPSVITVGTGSYTCNCDHCNDSGYETIGDAIADCVGSSDLSDIEATMLKNLDEIEVGYFDDEKVETCAR